MKPIIFIDPNKKRGDRVFHQYDVSIAEVYGLHEAIVLNHYQMWHLTNKAKNNNYYNGHYWSYNSLEVLQKLLRVLSEWDIRTALTTLCEAGLLVRGNYGKDRRSWYALTYRACADMDIEPLNDWNDLQKMIDLEVEDGLWTPEIAESFVKSTQASVNLTQPFVKSTDAYIYKDTEDNTTEDKKHSILFDSKKSNLDPLSFDAVWDLYNKKDNRKKAETAWKNLTKQHKRSVVDSIPLYLAWLKKNPDTAKLMFTTYIHGRRWEDERVESMRKAVLPDSLRQQDELAQAQPPGPEPEPSPTAFNFVNPHKSTVSDSKDETLQELPF